MELPTELVGNLVSRGQILHSDIFNDIDHSKFFVVMGISEDSIAGFFYINSKINRNINKKNEQLQLQYPISASDYSFLSYNSYICATNIIELPKQKLINSIIEKRTKLVGSLNEIHLNKILEKVRASRVFSKIEKRRYFY